MLEGLLEAFEARFGRRAEATARAPGRVNLIGEHTDYTGGLVLPCAVDRATWAAAARRDDRRARVWSAESGEAAASELDLGALRRRGRWVDYVAGVAHALAERGHAPPGFDLALASDVPLGAGLSSSASLQVAVVTVLDALFGWALSPIERARLAHRGETAFVGVACGIMDPFASALAREGHALRLDCRSQRMRHVPFPTDRAALLVAHSGVARTLASAAYETRVAECAEALAAARRRGLAAASLRDVSPAELPRLEAALAPRPFRRARHVVRENARVDALAAALRTGDLPAAGALLREGMVSLREDYEVSTPELDFLCEAADALPGVYGSRLTGAGFGGCTLHMVERDAEGDAARALADAFRRRFGRATPVWPLSPAAGCTVLPLP